MYLQVLLSCIAELSKLPLRELSLAIQPSPGSAAFLAPFQQLPPTLRQLLLICGAHEPWHAVPEADLLYSASPPAQLQTTALRQV